MKKRLLLVFVFLTLSILPMYGQLHAQDSLLIPNRKDSLVISSSHEKSMTGYYVKAFFATLAIILFIVFGARWYRKMSGQQQWSGRQSIRILNRKNVGNKQFILIVALEDKKYAIGVTEQNISLLAELGPLSQEEQQLQDKVPQAMNFAQIFNKLKAPKSS